MIKFTYDLVGTGWSKCVLEIKNKKIITTASYLDDALGNLSDAIYQALCGKKYSKAIFTEEPGEYRWVFEKINNEITNLKIIEYDDLWLNLPDKDGTIIFETEISIIEFSKAFINGVTNLFNKYGMEGYKKTWIEHNFPQRTIEKIKSLL